MRRNVGLAPNEIGLGTNENNIKLLIDKLQIKRELDIKFLTRQEMYCYPSNDSCEMYSQRLNNMFIKNMYVHLRKYGEVRLIMCLLTSLSFWTLYHSWPIKSC